MRRFTLERDVLERFSPGEACIVYVVHAAHENFFAFCDEYYRWHDDAVRINRIEIGRIRLKE